MYRVYPVNDVPIITESGIKFSADSPDGNRIATVSQI